MALLGDYSTGDLAPDVRAKFESHLRRCPRCVAYLRSYAEVTRLVRDIGAASASQAAPPATRGTLEVLVPEILAAAIRTPEPGPTRRRRR